MSDARGVKAIRYDGDRLRDFCNGNPVGENGRRVRGALVLRGVDLSGVEIVAIDLRDCDLSGADLRRTVFRADALQGSVLDGADADEAVFDSCAFDGASLRNLRGKARFSKCTFAGTSIAGVDFSKTDVLALDLANAADWHLAIYNVDHLRRGFGLPLSVEHNEHVRMRDFRDYNFRDCKLVGFDFENADLRGAQFFGADLSHAKITPEQLWVGQNWLFAKYDDGLGTHLGLASDHNARVAHDDFSGADLSGLDLSKVQLQGRDLRGARLVNTDLSGVNLTATRLEGADLTGAKLCRTVLEGAIGLHAWQLRGTDTSEAKLPAAIAEWKGLEMVSTIAPSTTKQFLAMLAACLYCWLTIATTTDVTLILGSATQPLPVVQTPIPIIGFYWFAPVLLVVVLLYFQLNLQRMWEALAKLPAIFPDGRRLDERAYPWMLIQKVRAHYQLLRGEYTAVPRMENWLGSALAYGAVPITLLALLGRTLVKHDHSLTAWQVVLWTTAMFIWAQFHRYAAMTLRGIAPRQFRWMSVVSVAGCIAFGVMVWFTATAIQAHSGANLSHARLSRAENGRVQAAQLASANLENANLAGAELANAVLFKADLKNANLFHADLSGAVLIDTDLTGADLNWANIQGADLYLAKIDRTVKHAANWILATYDPDRLVSLGLPADHAANLKRRDLRGYQIEDKWVVFDSGKLNDFRFDDLDIAAAHFANADLSGASFVMAKLMKADFDGAKMTRTNLSGADLSHATGLTETQLRDAILSADTKLPELFSGLIPAHTHTKTTVRGGR